MAYPNFNITEKRLHQLIGVKSMDAGVLEVGGHIMGNMTLAPTCNA